MLHEKQVASIDEELTRLLLEANYVSIVMRRPRLAYVLTHPLSVHLLMRGQLAYMRQQGFEVCVICSPGPILSFVEEREGVDIFPVPIAREISIHDDLKAFWILYRLMRSWRPDIVNASTPKAGFLGMIAAAIAGVPARIYVLRGLRIEGTEGLLRLILRATERISAACAHRVLCISRSLKNLSVDLGVVPQEKAIVIGSGSSNGIDASRFAVRPSNEVAALREHLKIPESAPVIGFVGRFTRDKGIVELVEAFEYVKLKVPEVKLLLVGDFEEGDPIPDQCVQRIHEHPDIALAGYVDDTAPYYSLMDVLVFPSYREGFGNVCLEAAAAGKPTVGFRATGVVDAVVDGETGTLVEVGNIEALARACITYLKDEELRNQRGEAAKRRGKEDFRPERVWEGLRDEYERLLRAKGRPIPSVQ